MPPLFEIRQRARLKLHDQKPITDQIRISPRDMIRLCSYARGYRSACSRTLRKGYWATATITFWISFNNSQKNGHKKVNIDMGKISDEDVSKQAKIIGHIEWHGIKPNVIAAQAAWHS